MARCAAPIQLPSGSWQIHWVDATGRRRSATYATFNEARQELARRQVEAVEVRRGERAPPPPRKTFAELADHWLATKGAEKRSPKDDASILRCHLMPAFAKIALTELSYERIEAFKASRGHLARQTVRNILNLLGAMLKHARKLGWLRPDQVPAIDRPSAAADERAFCYLRTDRVCTARHMPH